MARDILRMYGPDSRQPQASPVDCGGIDADDISDVNRYRPPQGPTSITDPKTVGLHGKNHGNTNGPDHARSPRGRPGLGGTVHKCGSQGEH